VKLNKLLNRCFFVAPSKVNGFALMSKISLVFIIIDNGLIKFTWVPNPNNCFKSYPEFARFPKNHVQAEERVRLGWM